MIVLPPAETELPDMDWGEPLSTPIADDFVANRSDAIIFVLLGLIVVLLSAILTNLAGWWK